MARRLGWLAPVLLIAGIVGIWAYDGMGQVATGPTRGDTPAINYVHYAEQRIVVGSEPNAILDLLKVGTATNDANAIPTGNVRIVIVPEWPQTDANNILRFSTAGNASLGLDANISTPSPQWPAGGWANPMTYQTARNLSFVATAGNCPCTVVIMVPR